MLTENARQAIDGVIASRKQLPGALLPILHGIQDAVGHIPREVVDRIARELNLSRAEVHGVVTYYHHFRAEPAGRHVVQICRAEACQSMGGEALWAHACAHLGRDGRGTTPDGLFTLEPVYCLGLCASSPAMSVDGEVHARVGPDKFDRLVAQARAVAMSRRAAPKAHNTAARSAQGSPVSIRIFVPRDSAALAVGADEVAAAIRHEALAAGLEVELVRNGSRGLFWLEPLVEVLTEPGRVAYGPVRVEDVAGLFAASFQTGGAHALRLGLTEDIPYLRKQERLTFARMGVTDPLSLSDYQAHEGYAGLRRALVLSAAEVVQQVLDASLRGRGGAAFPAGIKWKTVAGLQASQKYIVCNADEGDSGTYSDRMTMEGDPFMLIEGMTIAGIATGATEGYVYIRSEYPHAIATMVQAIGLAEAGGFLGPDVLGSGHAFHLHVRKAAGSYVCGEETAMLESLEGKRGIVRAKPPIPAISGLFGKPSVINNVITFASVPVILARGADFYRNYGVGKSRGTLPIQLAGNIRHGGLVEKAFGVTLRELLYDYGGGSASGRPIKAVQVGGPLGTYVPASQWDIPLDYEAYAAVGAVVGHGGIVVHDDTADMARLARYAMEFCAMESCGKCTPCRIGSMRGVEVIDRIRSGENRAQQVGLLRDLCDTMVNGSLCAMGGMTPFPVLSALDHYPQDFGIAVPQRREA